jgi:hypothetical protein
MRTTSENFEASNTGSPYVTACAVGMPKTPTRALTTEIAAHFERKDLGLMGQLYRSGVLLSAVLSTWFLYKT